MHSPSGTLSSRLIACIFLVLGIAGLEAAPLVNNITASQRPGTKLVDITYDLAAPGFGAVAVSLAISSDGGASYAVPVASATGDVGGTVTPGTSKAIVWDAGTDWPRSFSSQMRFRVTADDGGVPPLAGFSVIPAGIFTMGTFNEPSYTRAAQIRVNLSGFYMQQTETTKAQWDVVRTWASTRGYSDLPAGGAKSSDHPVHTVNWWDVIKWCNARSEKEGLTPVYTSGGAILRTGTTAPLPPTANWSANGYRLPTEAEWEKAARGGLIGKIFPWGNTPISHAKANYAAGQAVPPGFQPSSLWDQSSGGYHPAYVVGDPPYTSPAGSFEANGFGLYDMAGNVREWCWDPWMEGAYAFIDGMTDPHVPFLGFNIVVRGGSWGSGSFEAMCFNRSNYGVAATDTTDTTGFRPLRRTTP
jgi:formylglycine-generating enzyme required for sulfatase activity